MRIRTISLSLLSTAAFVATPAMAQGSGQLEEIVVTAQKRETSLEKTPMTINVLGGEQLQMQGMKEVKDLKASVPGLTLNESPGGLPGISVRGIGTSANNQLFEQSVGLFVDGVYHPRNRQYREAMFDVERVEVVKGSQGVLFGKNTSVGAISLVTRRPGRETGGYFQVDHELNFGSTDFQGAVDVRPTDNFGIRISGDYNDISGYVRNVTKNRDELSGNRYVIRAVADWDVTPNLNALLKLQWGNIDTIGNPFQLINATPSATAIALGIADGGTTKYKKYESQGSNIDTTDYQRSFDPSLILKYDFDSGYSITSTTGFSRYTYANGFDSDGTPMDWLANNFGERFKQFSQELRVASPVGGSVDFVAGAIYLNSRSDYSYVGTYNGLPNPAAGPLYGTLEQTVLQKEDAFAVFANVNWHLTEELTLSAGGRFSSDKKDGTYTKTLISDGGHPFAPSCVVSGCYLAAVVPGSTLRVKNTDNTFDFSGTLSYAIAPSATLYVSAGRGNKGAGFNNQAPTAASLAPAPFLVPRETATTFEAGIKGRFLDGRAFASLAGFILDVKDYQDSFYDATVPGFVVRSIDAKTRGVEGEGQFKVARPLTLFGNFSWLPTAKQSSTGVRLQRAPKFTYTLGVRGNSDISPDLALAGFLSANHSSTFYHQLPGSPITADSGSYTLVNAKLELTHKPLGLTGYVAVNNITKETYNVFTFGSLLGLGTFGALNEPRTVTIGARINF